ncbi:hypothetical protein AAG570_013098 [Ranatra chinensis]|uniref:Myotubularin-related protein 14 n=1 Tax=Ranatra chinensis TaxID=642074 RepID=A0ABD0YFU9_9HEMI
MEYELAEKCNIGVENSCTTPNRMLYESVYDVSKLKDLISKARFARCRARFPLPVILYKGKNICRSATLSGGPEIYGRSGLDYLFCGDDSTNDYKDEKENDSQDGEWQLFGKVRNQDIRLLRTLNVGTIIDFMVEKKKVKFGVNVTSSEKVDKENRYSEFTIISLPYPGCEFFKEFRDNDYVAEGLIFDWSQAHVDASIGIPNDIISSQLKIDWDKYKMWDLVRLTQNYMQLLLKYLVDQPLGLLIHCISGWDRTPLFVSLLRLSLWADGVVHQTLSPAQILYFTIAYDWMLFGHNLEDRLGKGEDIFFFCFYFLKHMASEDFSVLRWGNKTKSSSVLRTDSDSQLEGLLLDADAPISSQDSNISLNSSWSSISSKSQDTPPVYFHTEDQGQNMANVTSFSESLNCQQIKTDMSNNPGGFLTVPPSQPSTVNTVDLSYENSTLTPISDIKHNHFGPVPDSGHGRLTGSKTNNSRTSPVAVPSRTSNIRQRNESTSSLSTGSWQFISGTGSLRGSGSNSTCGSHLSSNHSRTPLSESQMLGDSTTTIMEDDCFIYSTNSSDPSMSRRERLRSVRTLFYNCYCSTIGFKLKDGSDSNSLGNLLGNFAEKVGIRSAQRTSV